MSDQVEKPELTGSQIETIADAAIEVYVENDDAYTVINQLMVRMISELAFTEVVDNGGQRIWENDFIRQTIEEQADGTFAIDANKKNQLLRTAISALAYDMCDSYILHTAVEIFQRIEVKIEKCKGSLGEKLKDYGNYGYENENAIIQKIKEEIFTKYIDKKVFQIVLQRNIELIKSVHLAMWGFFENIPVFPPEEA